MTSQTQVLIVGAGPTGLALAAHLLRLGVRVRLVDKKPGRSTTSKAIGLQYRVSEVLACMGVVDRFLAAGGTPTVVNINAAGKQLVRLKFEPSATESARDAFTPRAIVIRQSETERILGDFVRERGGAVEWNTELLGFRQEEMRIVARLRVPNGTEEELLTDWLVSCEGAHSVVREQAAIPFAGKTYPLAFLLADVELDGPLAHGESYVWLHKKGSFAALPFAEPGAWRLLIDVTNEKDGTAGEVSLDLICQIMEERVGGLGIKIRNPSWISEFKIHCRMVDRYRVGRVLIAGDAAHVHSPTGGQGIVTGIQDATNLAWKLGRVLRGAPESLIDTYEEERLPKAAEVLKETDRTTMLLLAPTALTRLLRKAVLLPIMRMRWVQRKLFAKLAQLHVNYRTSSVSQNNVSSSWTSRAFLKAGDRAPDVAFHDSFSGKMTTLFALLEPLRPVVVTDKATFEKFRKSGLIGSFSRAEIDAYAVVGKGSRLQGEEHHLIDLHGDFQRLYGATTGFLYLIRPDDHIGLFQRPPDQRKLRDYLSRIAA